MAATTKVSMALEQDELGWAKARARREGRSLSAVVTESLAAQRRLEALGDVIEWMQAGQAPLTPAELTTADRALRSRRK